MHKRAKLLLACITLLNALTKAMATSTEFNSIVIFPESSDEQTLMFDNLEENNLILHECHYSPDTSQTSCDISGSPAEETTLQKCNVKINATNIGSVGAVRVEGVYRFRDNKIIVHVKGSQSVSSFHIFKNCVPLNVVSSVNRKDGIVLELYKIIYYEDGFDIAMPESLDENAKMHYLSFDSDGKQIGNYTVPSEQLPYRTLYWHPKTHVLQFAKKHSRGVAFSSGYHFYPNGTIVQFADEEHINIMKSDNLVNDVDDGPFFTVCTQLPVDIGQRDELCCWQYDLDHAELTFKVEFTPPSGMQPAGMRNLSKGGFLLALCHQSTMTVYVIRPDRPTVIDNIVFGEKGCPWKVTDFNEKTSKITVIRSPVGASSKLTRSHYFLHNYAYTP